MPTVSQNKHTGYTAVFNGLRPDQNARVATCYFDFTANGTVGADNTYWWDGTNLQEKDRISFVQSVWIDNSQGATLVSMTIQGSNQTIICPPKSQGVFKAFMPNPPVFTVTGAGNGSLVQIQLSNSDLEPGVWSAANAPAGTITVSDPALEALISNGALATRDVADATAAPGPASTMMTQVGGIFHAAPPAYTDGQAGAVTITTQGQLITADANWPSARTTAAPGAAPTYASLVGGKYNSVLTTLTSGQSAALAVDVNSRLLVTETVLATSTAPPGGGSRGTTALLMAACYQTTPPALANGQAAALQLDNSSNLLTKDLYIAQALAAKNGSAAGALAIQSGGIFNSASLALTTGQGAALALTAAASLITAGNGRASGDVERPTFTAFKAFNVSNAAPGSAGTLTLVPAITAGLYIKRIIVDIAIIATGGGLDIITLKDGATVLATFPMYVLGAAGQSNSHLVFDMDYFSPSSGTTITASYGAVSGLSGNLSFTTLYAQTAFIGP